MPSLLINKKDLLKYKIDKGLKIKKLPLSVDFLGVIVLVNKKQFNNINKLPYGEERIKYIQSKEFLDNVYGYYYVFYDNKKNILEIREYISNSEHLKEVIDCINLYLPSDINIWTGLIPPDKVDMYIKHGFNQPYICKKSPLKHNYRSKGIAFIKTNPNSKFNISSIKNKLKHARNTDNNKVCKIYAKFTPETIKYLRQINDPVKNKKELSGSLIISRVINKDNKIIFELSSDPSSVISGQEEEVDAVWSRYNFHTHPKKAYINQGVKKGWPSSQDYVGFIQLNHHTIFHTVVTLEGIYIISFSPEWIGKISKIDKNYVLKHYDINHKENISFEKYVNIINNKKYKGKSPLFIVMYMKWDNATKEFPIFYSKTHGSCLVTDKQYNLYKK
jgi:hypothetical protein